MLSNLLKPKKMELRMNVGQGQKFLYDPGPEGSWVVDITH